MPTMGRRWPDEPRVRQEWERIKTNLYRTPPSEARGMELYSLGILNVTKAEGDLIAEFARQLQFQRQVPADKKLDRITMPLQKTLETFNTEADAWGWPQPKPAAPKAETEPAKPANRFSGLDFGEDK